MDIESARGFRVGRLGRGVYALSIFSSMFAFMGVGLLINGLIRGGFEGSPSAILWVPILAWWTFAIYCSVLRLRDLDMSLWWLVSIFIPFLNIYLIVKLFLFTSSKQVKT